MSTIPIPCRIAPSSQKFPEKYSETTNKIIHQVFFFIKFLGYVFEVLTRLNCYWLWMTPLLAVDLLLRKQHQMCTHFHATISYPNTVHVTTLAKKLQGFQMSFRPLKTPKFYLNLHFEP